MGFRKTGKFAETISWSKQNTNDIGFIFLHMGLLTVAYPNSTKRTIKTRTNDHNLKNFSPSKRQEIVNFVRLPP